MMGAGNRQTFLRTRVGRRMVGVFILCTILPLGFLGVLTWRSLRTSLLEQASERLHRTSKLTGQALHQRLDLLRGELQFLATSVLDGASGTVPGWRPLSPDGHFLRLSVEAPDSSGLPWVEASLDPMVLAHLGEGKAVIRTAVGDGVARVFLATLVNPGPAERVAWAEIAPAFLWAPPLGNGAGAPTPDLCVLGDGGQPLYCADEIAAAWAARSGAGTTPVGLLDVETADGRFFAISRPLFMRYDYLQPDWTVIAGDPAGSIMASLEQARTAWVLLLVTLSLAIVLTSQILVRRNLEPLARLSDATERIAQHRFDEPVRITTNDEFGRLAASFNAMAQNLDGQFRGLNAIAELGQTLLAARGHDAIALAALHSATLLVSCHGVALVLTAEADAEDSAGGVWIHSGNGGAHRVPSESCRALPPSTTMRMLIGPGHRFASDLPHALRSIGAPLHLVLPLSIDNRCVGYIAFARTDANLPKEQDLFANQLRDLVAVALASARLVAAMDELSWGALRALARAIDAKSPWTAGHSERVTALALVIGRRLGLDDVDLERLERGGLLHDVGKIGVPAHVLDKPGKLDAVEWEQMKAHTTLGARILEPIRRYADVLPIVLYHHEKLDGTGYPEGRAGEDIPLLARVLAVADVYDALVSDRPYRPGMEESAALALIEQGIGTHFDPAPARAFLELMREENGRASTSIQAVYSPTLVLPVA